MKSSGDLLMDLDPIVKYDVIDDFGEVFESSLFSQSIEHIVPF